MNSSENIVTGGDLGANENKLVFGPGHTPQRVLIVDDEPEIVEEVIEQLDSDGLDCVYALNAQQAINMVGSDPEISVIVTDIRMPGMDGLEMARKLKETAGSSRDLYIIVVTGHAGMQEAITALQLGAEDFLTKPISPNHLLHSVRRAEEMVHLRTNERLFKVHLEQQIREKTAEARELAENLADQNLLLEQKNLELEGVNRLKDEFLQMMSHELNTPLNAITGFAQLLKEILDDKDDDKGRQCAEHILSAGTRLAGVVKSILTLSELSAGSLRLDTSRFTARNFIDALISEFGPTLNSWNTRLRVDIPDRPFEITADFNQLKYAAGHLIENAAKYGNEGEQVILSIDTDKDRVKISIRDEGCGMTEKQILAAIEPLRHLDGTVGRKYEGMGLGLPLAKGIAELHGGKLEIDSVPGEGSTVTISISQK